MAATGTIRPEDVVVGLLAVLWEKDYERFKADPVSVHSNFYQWRENANFSQLFDQFVFDTRDYFPYSETLDQVFDGLQLAGYLERTNPRGIYYMITPEVKALFKKDVGSKFKGPQRKALEALAEEFIRNIKPEKKRAGR
jgi:hypothetical protein